MWIKRAPCDGSITFPPLIKQALDDCVRAIATERWVLEHTTDRVARASATCAVRNRFAALRYLEWGTNEGPLTNATLQ